MPFRFSGERITETTSTIVYKHYSMKKVYIYTSGWQRQRIGKRGQRSNGSTYKQAEREGALFFVKLLAIY